MDCGLAEKADAVVELEPRPVKEELAPKAHILVVGNERRSTWPPPVRAFVSRESLRDRFV